MASSPLVITKTFIFYLLHFCYKDKVALLWSVHISFFV